MQSGLVSLTHFRTLSLILCLSGVRSGTGYRPTARIFVKNFGALRARGHNVVGRVLARVGGWSDAGPPIRGGWVVGRDGYLKYRDLVHLHLGKGRAARPHGGGPAQREQTRDRGVAVIVQRALQRKWMHSPRRSWGRRGA